MTPTRRTDCSTWTTGRYNQRHAVQQKIATVVGIDEYYYSAVDLNKNFKST